MLLLEAILILCWLGMAAWHAHLIKANKPIEHGRWGLAASFLIVSACWIYGNGRPIWQIGLFALAQVCSRLVVFNIFLNLFRGKKWNYTSSVTTSIIDRLELRLFGGRVWLLEAILAALFMGIQLFI